MIILAATGGDIAQEDGWTVVTAYFREKGLVRQQLDSFNEFLNHTVQELVAARTIELREQLQYRPGDAIRNDDERVKIRPIAYFSLTFPLPRLALAPRPGPLCLFSFSWNYVPVAS